MQGRRLQDTNPRKPKFFLVFDLPQILQSAQLEDGLVSDQKRTTTRTFEQVDDTVQESLDYSCVAMETVRRLCGEKAGSVAVVPVPSLQSTADRSRLSHYLRTLVLNIEIERSRSL